MYLKFITHRRAAKYAEVLLFFFSAERAERKRNEKIYFSAAFASRATCRVVARRAKPEAGGEYIAFSKYLYKEMPENNIKAMAIRPVAIMVMPKPSRPAGTFAYRSFCLMADMETMASIQPTPEPMPNTNDSIKL